MRFTDISLRPALPLRLAACLTFAAASVGQLGAQEAVFSGPQVGERLPPLEVVAVLGERSGETVDQVAVAGGKPMLLVFVHKLTRPGMALVRSLTNYAKSQAERGLVAGIVWLDEDKAAAEAYLRRAQKSLNFTVPVGVSTDGGEGPGAYGLNRNVELTILVAQDNVVTANFALVQPSVSEAAQIAGEVAKVIDQPPPSEDAMEKWAYPGRAEMRSRPQMRRGDNAANPGADAQRRSPLRNMMQTLIAADASGEQIQQTTDRINQWVGDDQQRRAALSRMSSAVLARDLAPEQVRPTLEAWRQAKPDQDADADPAEQDNSDPASPQP